MTKKLLILVNPISGKSKALKILPFVKSFFDSNQIDYDIIISKYKGHIEKILLEYDFTDYFSCCILGGDGSFHEAVNGYMKKINNIDIALSLIPAGSGNSLARDLKILNYKKALEKIKEGQIKLIDVGKISYDSKTLYSFNIAGWGMVATVGKKAEKYRWLGSSRYTILSLIEIIFKKTYNANLIILDDKDNEHTIKDKFMFVMISNTIHTGKGMKIAPKATLDDGCFDLIIIKDTPRFKLFKLMSKLFSGRHILDDAVQYKHIKKIILETDQVHDLNIDGEMKGSSPFSLEVKKKVVKIIN